MLAVDDPIAKAHLIGTLLNDVVMNLDTRITALEKAQPPEPEPPNPPEGLHNIGSWYIDRDLKARLQLDMAIGMFAPTNPANLIYLCDTLKLSTVQALIYGPHLGWSKEQMLQAADTVGQLSMSYPQITLLLDDFWATADTLGRQIWEKVILTARQYNSSLKVYIVVYPFQLDRHLYQGWQNAAWPNGVSLWVWDWENIRYIDFYYNQINDIYGSVLALMGGVYVTDYVHGGDKPIPVYAFQDLQTFWCEKIVKGEADGLTTLFYPAAIKQWPEYIGYAKEVYSAYR